MSIFIYWVYTLAAQDSSSLQAAVYHTIKFNGLPSTVSSMSLHCSQLSISWGGGEILSFDVITKLNRRRACNAWVRLICSVLMGSPFHREGNNRVSDGGEAVACGSQLD